MSTVRETLYGLYYRIHIKYIFVLFFIKIFVILCSLINKKASFIKLQQKSISFAA